MARGNGKNKKDKLENFPEWLEAEKKLAGIQVDLNQIDSRLREIQAEQREDSSLEAAENYLAGKDMPDRSRDEEINQLHQKRKVLMTAIGIQRQEVDRIRRECSLIICDNLNPEYMKLFQNRDDKILAAFEAEIELAAFIQARVADGVLCSWAVLPYPGINFQNFEQRKALHDQQKAAYGLGGKVHKVTETINPPASDKSIKGTERASGQLSVNQVEQARRQAGAGQVEIITPV